MRIVLSSQKVRKKQNPFTTEGTEDAEESPCSFFSFKFFLRVLSVLCGE